MKPLDVDQGIVCGPGQASFRTRQIGALLPGQVLVRVRATALCGSDLHIFRGKHPSAPLPVTIGHEFAGEVAAIGPAVTGHQAGDRVIVEPCIACGQCDACRQGHYAYCESLQFTYRMGDGAMASHVVVPASCLHTLPQDMDFVTGSLIEPLSVAMHAVRRAQVTLGDRVHILGGGAIGILVAALCVRSGASRVCVTEPREERRALALAFGATHAQPPGEQDMATGAYDMAFECVGMESTLHTALKSVRKNGLVSIVGIFEQPNIILPVDIIVSRELRLQGTQGYCWDFPASIAIANDIGLRRLVTHTYPLRDLQRALEDCMDPQKKVIKAVLLPEEETQ